MEMKKRIRSIILYVSLIILSWVIVGIGSAASARRPVQAFVPKILNEESNHFLDAQAVEELVQDVQGKKITDCKLGEIKIPQMEGALRANPYVEQAEAWKDLSGTVHVELMLRRPIARVMPDSMAGYYVDREFRRMDVSPRYSANVPLVRGAIDELVGMRDSAKVSNLRGFREMLLAIDQEEFFRAQVSELVISPKGEVTIFPEIGDIDIDFGKPTRIEEKLGNLKLFYEKVLNVYGWDKYRRISLKYRGIIVAKK